MVELSQISQAVQQDAVTVVFVNTKQGFIISK